MPWITAPLLYSRAPTHLTSVLVRREAPLRSLPGSALSRAIAPHPYLPRGKLPARGRAAFFETDRIWNGRRHTRGTYFFLADRRVAFARARLAAPLRSGFGAATFGTACFGAARLGAPTDCREAREKDGRIVKTAVEARGARLGRPVLIVLIVSTLAVIGMFSLLCYGSFG